MIQRLVSSDNNVQSPENRQPESDGADSVPLGDLQKLHTRQESPNGEKFASGAIRPVEPTNAPIDDSNTRICKPNLDFRRRKECEKVFWKSNADCIQAARIHYLWLLTKAKVFSDRDSLISKNRDSSLIPREFPEKNPLSAPNEQMNHLLAFLIFREYFFPWGTPKQGENTGNLCSYRNIYFPVLT